MSKQLGHHKVTTTEDFYSHLIEENKEKVSACIADAPEKEAGIDGEAFHSPIAVRFY